jgi:DNA polymerase III subunit delta'
MSFKFATALSLLQRARERGRLGHAYLITGPNEADLTTFAAKALNLVSDRNLPDLAAWEEKRDALVVRPGSKSRRITIDSIREDVEPFLHVTSSGAEHRFCVFEDAERMTEQAQNAFLRTLEDPPPRTLFLLLSTHPETFLETILSRVIRIPLMPGQARKLSDDERRLVTLLSELASRHADSLAAAMSLRKEFEHILEAVYDRLTKQFESAFEEEKKHFKQTTDVDSAWLKERESEAEAAIESHYRQERDALMELLLAWLGDVLRHQVGVERLDLPEHAAATRALAGRWDTAVVSRRLKELRRLHSNLHTNVQEGLALEAAFIAAFA